MKLGSKEGKGGHPGELEKALRGERLAQEWETDPARRCSLAKATQGAGGTPGGQLASRRHHFCICSTMRQGHLSVWFTDVSPDTWNIAWPRAGAQETLVR